MKKVNAEYIANMDKDAKARLLAICNLNRAYDQVWQAALNTARNRRWRSFRVLNEYRMAIYKATDYIIGPILIDEVNAE